jgi:glutamate carboxypeptidase
MLDARELLSAAENREEDIVATLIGLAEIESPSDNKDALDRVAQFAAGRFANLGGRVAMHPQATAGDHLQVTFGGRAHGKPILLLGHLDTVWPLGTLRTMPVRESGGKLYGPGVFDMKAGVAMMVHAIAMLQKIHGLVAAAGDCAAGVG